MERDAAPRVRRSGLAAARGLGPPSLLSICRGRTDDELAAALKGSAMSRAKARRPAAQRATARGREAEASRHRADPLDEQQSTSVNGEVADMLTGSRAAIAASRRCRRPRAARDAAAVDLWKRGTQTVFGEGAAQRRVMLVGEQPGDRRICPAVRSSARPGRLLDRALADAGIDRDAGLRHQRRQALQVGAARQAPDPQEAERRRGRARAGPGSTPRSRW